MPHDISIVLRPDEAANETAVVRAIARKIDIPTDSIRHYYITRKSIDARKGKVLVNLCVRVFIGEEKIIDERPIFNYNDVRNAMPVIIVGAGPAGLFAALRLIELGFKPIVIERGKSVSHRKRDIAMLNREHQLNPDSNYAFGEGGAGTFSDGKLYTRSKKRGDYRRILQALVDHGADPAILYEAHPHIGTNRLPGIITRIRETILQHGGEVLFSSRVTEIIIDSGQAVGVKLADGQRINGKAVILATGHSARDIYHMLHNQSIALEAKPFAMGVRVEHPQALIDAIQYHGIPRSEYLPAAAYSLVHQVEGRGVYSFCMCPGGFIVPAATGTNEVVVNGMSPSDRNSRWANSGIVVEIRLDDLAGYAQHGIFAGLEFQAELERLAKQHGGYGVQAPAQRLVDFVEGRFSSNLPACSYHPGLNSSEMHLWLPEHIGFRLREGFKAFGKKMKGFLTNDAVILGVESRTSSPIRIPRDPETLQHIQVKGLFPSGEGAGYAGGIVSSALDGNIVADAVSRYVS
ncbi:NAD(P)/FAD-dependent oxidoreductase [Tenuifilum sp.]|uniref:NAD(P)/FAD-dependent oxidoreductase n=1 Tax=Tenuifilum sp. TaxID=2760880 RepID=UPI002C097A43|nr:FAD-binding protein [Tenuifilum sp.]HOK86607.1 FAD-binding protein [Tenuifilum sp.]HPP90929.1 FAD-binding protein [Tenuifilum sp.]